MAHCALRIVHCASPSGQGVRLRSLLEKSARQPWQAIPLLPIHSLPVAVPSLVLAIGPPSSSIQCLLVPHHCTQVQRSDYSLVAIAALVLQLAAHGHHAMQHIVGQGCSQYKCMGSILLGIIQYILLGRANTFGTVLCHQSHLVLAPRIYLRSA